MFAFSVSSNFISPLNEMGLEEQELLTNAQASESSQGQIENLESDLLKALTRLFTGRLRVALGDLNSRELKALTRINRQHVSAAIEFLFMQVGVGAPGVEHDILNSPCADLYENLMPTSKQRALLLLLWEAHKRDPEAFVSCDLLTQLTGIRHDSQKRSAVHVSIFRLRRRMEAYPRLQIEKQRGGGYRLVIKRSRRRAR